MTWWQDALTGIVVTWPPLVLTLWLGRKKLDNQTKSLTEVTDHQTEWLRPGWRQKSPRS